MVNNPTPKLKVLVVDDSPYNLYVLEEMLKQFE